SGFHRPGRQKNTQLRELRSMLWSSIYPKRSTAQSALHQTAKHVRADQSATTQASRQSWQEPACRRASTARFILKTKKSKSARPKNIYTTTYNQACTGSW
ncbi:unnamed protein product, partial [Laminaria digitata]